MKSFFKEYFLLEQSVADDYIEHLKKAIPDGLLPIQKVCLIAKEVESLSLQVLSNNSDVVLFESRIRLDIARRNLNFNLKQLQEVA